MNTAHLIHLELSKTCDFLKRGYLHSDSAISRIRHPVEVTLLEETLARILLLYKIKNIGFLFLFSALAAKM